MGSVFFLKETSFYLMLLIVGVKANRNVAIAIGLQASKREAPNAR